MEPDIEELVRTLIQGQIQTDKSVKDLAITVSKYVDASEARMRRLEENPDGNRHTKH